MLSDKNKSKIITDLNYLPLAKPWQLLEVIEIETSRKQYRLFRAVTWVRLIVAVLTFGFFLSTNTSHLALSLPIISMIISIEALKKNQTIGNTNLYPLLYALFDILTFTYIITYSSNSYEIGFIFFTLSLNAMILPFRQLLLVTCLGGALVFIGWFDINFSQSQLFISSDILEVIKEGQKTKEILTLIMGLFVVVFTIFQLTKMALLNEVKAIIQHKQLHEMLSFNRTIIENFNNGIIIFSTDTDAKIISINKKAIELLNINDEKRVTGLSELSSILFEQYKEWSSSLFGTSAANDSFTYQHNQGAEEVFISFTEFSKTNQNSIIMMTLESVNKTMQQAQEAKLTALGRLTAGIAHEIRNPLTAISSAADLLKENSDEQTKQKLISIIANNVQRTNRIINDILGLFRDKQANRQLLPVEQSLKEFSKRFTQSYNKQAFELTIINRSNKELYFNFDTTQLEQILWNLCSNAIKYAKSDNLQITISYELSSNQKRLYLYIYDNGKGINQEKATKIFEPFYAGSSEGSGLGLYLVRELCNANNANITYLLPKERSNQLPAIGACFRISAPVYFSQKVKPTITN